MGWLYKMPQKNFDENRETFDETDLFEGPWMATVEPGEEVHFEVDRTKMFVEEIPNPFETKNETINQGRGLMKNIRYAEGDHAEVDEDGEHVVPFWACGALKKILKKAKGAANKKWVRLGYYREAEDEDNYKGTDKTVTINSANFKLLD